MEPTRELDLQPPVETPAPTLGELVVQNGRLSGARRALSAPMTLIGQAEGCEVRLNVAGVNPFHCTLVYGPSGWVLQDLRSETGTLVNGDRVTSCVLQDGDLLSVGPFRFRLRLPAHLAQGNTYGVLSDEKEALRIQAAAVAAQQAALTEEELRLQQRQTALEQQEQQLSVHLEEKRQRLLELRDEAREAHATLQKERATYEQRVGEVTRNLASTRRDVTEAQRQVQSERQRLLSLRRRMKRRWHRHWAGERQVMRRREGQLQQERWQLEKERERLQQERAALGQFRLRFNGENELARRHLQAGWEQLREAQRAWEQRVARAQAEERERLLLLEQREQALAEAEHSLGQERQQWHATRLHLEREVEGLESRVRNHRRKILDQEQEVLRLEAIVRDLERRREMQPALSQANSAGRASPQESAALAEPASADLCTTRRELEQRAWQMREAEAELETRVAALETLADELSDQRLALAEQCERLVRGQQQWYQERTAAAGELEAMSSLLLERVQALASREQAIVSAECALRQRHEQVAHVQGHLEAWQARLAASAAAWEGERDRLLEDLRAREAVVERRQAGIAELRHRWEDRRRKFLAWLRLERNACEDLRQEWACLREECWRRSANLEREERTLAERTLALEQFRQECVGKAAHPRTVEKRLERLRRRWATLSASAERNLARERQALEAERTRVDERARQIKKHAEAVAAGEADFARRQDAWDHQQVLVEGEQDRLRQEVRSLQLRRGHYERQLEKLHEEVERLARFLLDESDNFLPPLGQAA